MSWDEQGPTLVLTESDIIPVQHIKQHYMFKAFDIQASRIAGADAAFVKECWYRDASRSSLPDCTYTIRQMDAVLTSTVVFLHEETLYKKITTCIQLRVHGQV